MNKILNACNISSNYLLVKKLEVKSENINISPFNNTSKTFVIPMDYNEENLYIVLSNNDKYNYQTGNIILIKPSAELYNITYPFSFLFEENVLSSSNIKTLSEISQNILYYLNKYSKYISCNTYNLDLVKIDDVLLSINILI